MLRELSRRDLIRLSSLAAGVSFVRCATSSFPIPIGRRSPVIVDRSRVIRTVVGLRPYRPSGFVLEAEPLGDKLLVHNYGHGGCGVTLSWGTAQLAVEHALQRSNRQAAVIGCGAVGLATARLLQDHGFYVTIYAKALPPETTSNMAGALWLPVTLVDRNRRTPRFDQQLEQATRFAWRYFQTLVGERYGVHWVETDCIEDRNDPELPHEVERIADLVPFNPLEPNPYPTRFARRLHTMLIEPPTYLRAVLEDFRLTGGNVVVREFADRASLSQLDEPIIVNCTGLGAHDLVGDAELQPIKGQLTVLLPQPEIDYATVGPGDLYMFSRRDGVILGGTHERGVWSLDVNAAEAERVFQGHRQLFGALRR